jgi:hypothetical protein
MLSMDSLTLQLEGGSDEAQKRAIDNICEYFLELAFDRQGCLLVQSALDNANATLSHKHTIVAGLQGHVWKALQSKHANFVLQKVIEVMPPARTDFIAEELFGTAGKAVRHKFGCRIICRLVEHGNSQAGTRLLIDEILEEAHELSEHQFGHIVLRSILRNGMLVQKACITRALQGRCVQLANHKHGSFIVQDALAYCGEQTRMDLANQFLHDPELIIMLARQSYGKHVVEELVRFHCSVPPSVLQEAGRCLESSSRQRS